MSEKSWTMPAWMEPYRPMLNKHTGGDTVEALMNDATSVSINEVRALIACNLKGAVSMLYHLRRANALGPEAEDQA